MSVMNLWRQLKKKLRTKRRWLALGVCAAIAAGAALLFEKPHTLHSDGNKTVRTQSAFAPIVQNEDAKKQADTLETIVRAGTKREVVLQKSYLCGEERQKIGMLKPDEVQKLHAEHPDWVLQLTAEGVVVFTENIDDLSPACKETAFFGIDDKGNLTLFQGVPSKNNALRTFYQLNIQGLESSLPRDTVNQLYSGIRVSDIAEYYSVLSTFSDFAVEETQKAMNHQSTER